MSIVEDRNGVIWAGGQYGFGKFEGGKWRGVGPELGYPAAGALTMLVDHRGSLWVATETPYRALSNTLSNTIVTLAPNTKRFKGTGESVDDVYAMAEAPDGEVWIGDYGRGTGRPVGHRRGPGGAIAASATVLLFDTERTLWLGLNSLSSNGLRRVADFKLRVNAAPDRFGVSDGLSNGWVRAALKDREGNLWFGTHDGLDRFSETKVATLTEREGVASNKNWALTSTPDGSIWTCQHSGDTIYRFLHGRTLKYKLTPSSPSDLGYSLTVMAWSLGRASSICLPTKPDTFGWEAVLNSPKESMVSSPMFTIGILRMGRLWTPSLAMPLAACGSV